MRQDQQTGTGRRHRKFVIHAGHIATTGAPIPAPVIVATVANPVAVQIITATSHASRIGDVCAYIAIRPIASPTPLVTSIYLNPPPAPMIRMRRRRPATEIEAARDVERVQRCQRR